MKLLVIAAVLVLAWKMLFGRWPWEGRGWSRPGIGQARTLLGVSPGADRAAILSAHRALIARVHPDRGGSSAAVHAADAARDLLLADAPRGDSPD